MGSKIVSLFSIVNNDNTLLGGILVLAIGFQKLHQSYNILYKD